jgi:hypothetical protein
LSKKLVNTEEILFDFRREGTGNGDWIFLSLKCTSIHLQEISRWYTRTKKWYHYHHGTHYMVGSIGFQNLYMVGLNKMCLLRVNNIKNNTWNNLLRWHSKWKPIHHYDRTYYYILDIILASVFQPRDYILRHPGVDLFQILKFVYLAGVM